MRVNEQGSAFHFGLRGSSAAASGGFFPEACDIGGLDPAGA
jgi:hypothetical protein